MHVIEISSNLLLAYAVVVFVGGGVLGLICGRAMRPRRPRPDTPGSLEHRVRLLELEAARNQALRSLESGIADSVRPSRDGVNRVA